MSPVSQAVPSPLAPSLSAIRHEPCTIIDQLMGYGDLIGPVAADESGAAAGTAVDHSIEKIRAAALHISGALDRWSSVNPNGRQLRNLGVRVQQLGNYIRKLSRQMVESVRASGARNNPDDFERLDAAAHRLISIAR